jgi:hypothetical protein
MFSSSTWVERDCGKVSYHFEKDDEENASGDNTETLA